MPQSEFKNVKVSGMLTVVSHREIRIYDEAQYYGGVLDFESPSNIRAGKH